MTTTNDHQWTIGPMSRGATEHRSGAAAAHTKAWTQALGTARAALLTGELDTLAVTVDVSGAVFNPAHDEHGAIDPAQLTATLVELHHAATGHNFADLPSER